ncbi:MAG TPA: quinoprotein dehydrogenase-associated SoxYZ-like carrier, partial [Acetobacteraceae bacterium]|nr:quinoprotein dehydrogenase-associated SoxYZ-like carrier [Acetobacteraceae bacterium]
MAVPAHAADDDAARAARWHDLAKLIFDGRQPVDQAGWLTIDAPVRAMDAALVPVTIGLAPDKK